MPEPGRIWVQIQLRCLSRMLGAHMVVTSDPRPFPRPSLTPILLTPEQTRSARSAAGVFPLFGVDGASQVGQIRRAQWDLACSDVACAHQVSRPSGAATIWSNLYLNQHGAAGISR